MSLPCQHAMGYLHYLYYASMMLSSSVRLVDRQARSEPTTTSSSTASFGQALRGSLVKPEAYLSESYWVINRRTSTLLRRFEKEKARLKRACTALSRRRPTLPHSYPCSTIGAEGLNFRVRKGNGCDPFAMTAENLYVLYMTMAQY